MSKTRRKAKVTEQKQVLDDWRALPEPWLAHFPPTAMLGCEFEMSGTPTELPMRALTITDQLENSYIALYYDSQAMPSGL